MVKGSAYMHYGYKLILLFSRTVNSIEFFPGGVGIWLTVVNTKILFNFYIGSHYVDQAGLLTDLPASAS